MARSTPATSALKRQLVLDLELARASLAEQTRKAQAQFSPFALVQRSVQRHKVAWIIGGIVAGVAIVRLLLPPKFRSDKSGQSDKTRGFTGIMRSLFFTVAQRAAMNYAKTHFKDQARAYFDSFLNRQGPDRSNHVPS